MTELTPTYPDPYRSPRDLSDGELHRVIEASNAILSSEAWWGAQLNAQVSRQKALAELRQRGM